MKITDKLIQEYGANAKLKYVGTIWGGMSYTMSASELQEEIANSDYDLELDGNNKTIPAEEFDSVQEWAFDLDEVRVKTETSSEVVFQVEASEMSKDSEELNTSDASKLDNIDNLEVKNDIKDTDMKNEAVEKVKDMTPEFKADKAPKLPAKKKTNVKAPSADKKADVKKIKVPETDLVDYSIFVKDDMVTCPGGISGKIIGTEIDKDTKAVKYKIKTDDGETLIYPEADLTRQSASMCANKRNIIPLKTFESYLK